MMKQRKVLSLLLTLSLLISLCAAFAISASAANATRERALMLTPAASASDENEGWAWDASTQTLTLNNFNLDQTSLSGTGNFNALSIEDNFGGTVDATIVLKGQNSITAGSTGEDGKYSWGIFIGGNCTITGDADSSLSVISGDATGNQGQSVGILTSGSLKFESEGYIVVNSGGGKAANVAVYSFGGITFKRGTVTLTGETLACQATSDITLADNVSVKGDTSYMSSSITRDVKINSSSSGSAFAVGSTMAKTITATYTAPAAPEKEQTMPFTDVSVNDWYYTPQVTYTVTASDGTTTTTEPETLDNSAIKAPVTISVALPLDMPQENLYVKHQLKDGSFEYIKPTIERNVATWQQSSFSIVVLTADSRTATVKMNDLDVTLTPEDVGKELPTVSRPGKDFTGWTFVINGVEYPGGPYTKLTDDLLTKLSEANEVTATPNFKDKTSSGGSSSGKIDSPNKPNKPNQSTMGEADASKFRDVSTSDWYFDAVQYVLEKGLMNGTSDWTFAPNDATTRGMIVTILARVEGVNTTGNPWYAAGQKWAIANGISDGANMPGVITREQLATILFRYLNGFDLLLHGAQLLQRDRRMDCAK